MSRRCIGPPTLPHCPPPPTTRPQSSKMFDFAACCSQSTHSTRGQRPCHHLSPPGRPSVAATPAKLWWPKHSTVLGPADSCVPQPVLTIHCSLSPSALAGSESLYVGQKVRVFTYLAAVVGRSPKQYPLALSTSRSTSVCRVAHQQSLSRAAALRHDNHFVRRTKSALSDGPFSAYPQPRAA